VFIEPLILIPFIENAFKHGVSYHQKSEVLIDLKVEFNSVVMLVRNTKKNGPVADHLATSDSGIGLVNIKRRLDLLYPNRHTLTIDDGKDYFTVNLKIQP
jgi:two-component system, LytTR family, sensor kinase